MGAVGVALGPNCACNGASSARNQAFLLIGTLFLLPMILMYTVWSYWVFRRNMRADMGYHGRYQ